MTPPSIITVGGGGFLLHDTRYLQERYILSHARPTPNRKPQALYLGTASGDADRGQLQFIKAFSSLGCEAQTLTFFPFEMKRHYAQAVAQADIVYVGGGNTVGMVAVWREFGFDQHLRAAYQSGTVLAGISAGANCWFERYITDSVPGGGAREGLGLLPGTYCPHLDSEAWRQPLLAQSAAPAFGAGEYVCMLFENGRLKEAVHDTPAHLTHKVPMCRVRESAVDTLRDLAPRLLAD
jgi:dipeptidase E